MKINKEQRDVLAWLDAHTHEELFMPFAPMVEELKMPRDVIRRACRYLKRKGLAQFMRGLSNDDGEFAGAGYAITQTGKEWLNENSS